MRILAAVAVLATLVVQQAAAQPTVTGSITFNGAVTLFPTNVTSVDNATGIETWVSPYVQSAGGSFASINAFTMATIVSNWSFNSGPISNFWTIGTNWSFSLNSSYISTQGGGTVSVLGTGTIYASGYAPTAGTWHFTAFDQGASGAPLEFNFSAITSTNVPPTITQPPTNQVVQLGASTSFAVTATGSPPLTYQWLFNGTNLTNNAQITGAQTNVLNLSSVTTNNSGTYEIIVSNAYGATNASATLTVVVPQPVIETVQRAGGLVNFTWSSVSNQMYIIQSTTNLATSNWTNLGATITATNSTSTTTEPIGTNRSQFYRIMVFP
jgi:hypothetical protein